MPRLWNDTIEAHRQAVREAILDTAWALVAERGLTSVTMSQIAERTGIGRATLYKYFPDVEAILDAWHQRHVAAHLDHLAQLREQDGSPAERLARVLQAYALIVQRRGRQDAALVSLLHSGEQVVEAQQRLMDLVQGLVLEGAQAGEVRADIRADELAAYCLHALAAAAGLSSEGAVGRLVDVTLSGLCKPV